MDAAYPAKRVVLVMDNLDTHTPASLSGAFEPAEARRIASPDGWRSATRRSTVAGCTWEIEIGAMVQQCLDRRSPAA